MSKKILKKIKILLIVFIIISLFFSFIVSQNTYHLKICHEKYCPICAIIYIAQTIISLSTVFIIYTFVGFLIYFLLSRLYKEQTFFMQSSLVFQKVQLNE